MAGAALPRSLSRSRPPPLRCRLYPAQARECPAPTGAQIVGSCWDTGHLPGHRCGCRVWVGVCVSRCQCVSRTLWRGGHLLRDVMGHSEKADPRRHPRRWSSLGWCLCFWHLEKENQCLEVFNPPQPRSCSSRVQVTPEVGDAAWCYSKGCQTSTTRNQGDPSWSLDPCIGAPSSAQPGGERSLSLHRGYPCTCVCALIKFVCVHLYTQLPT